MTPDRPLAPALPGDGFQLEHPEIGRIHGYATGPEGSTETPVLLVHSVNAAASAYEMRPLYERLGKTRPTYAFDLPGFGLSERRDRLYTPRLMTDAVLAVAEEVRGRHGGAPLELIALSLSAEFLARALQERPEIGRTAGLISPTGLDGRGRRDGPPGSHRGTGWVRGVLTFPLWADGLFRALTIPSVVRYFLEKTYGGKDIDEGLWAYDVATARAPGARHAPLSFLSGHLFSNDVARLYEALTLPVWVAHGVRGDFQDYSGLERMRDATNWTVTVYETGALPHFEVPDAFTDRYLSFLARA